MEQAVLRSSPMSDTKKRGVVTKENQDEAAALKKLWEARKADGRLTLGQEEFGERYGVGEKAKQQTVSGLLRGTIALTLETGAAFARVLEVDISEFSPRLRLELDRLYNFGTPQAQARGLTNSALRLALEFDSVTEGSLAGGKRKDELYGELQGLIQYRRHHATGLPDPVDAPTTEPQAARKRDIDLAVPSY